MNDLMSLLLFINLIQYFHCTVDAYNCEDEAVKVLQNLLLTNTMHVNIDIDLCANLQDMFVLLIEHCIEKLQNGIAEPLERKHREQENRLKNARENITDLVEKYRIEVNNIFGVLYGKYRVRTATSDVYNTNALYNICVLHAIQILLCLQELDPNARANIFEQKRMKKPGMRKKRVDYKKFVKKMTTCLRKIQQSFICLTDAAFCNDFFYLRQNYAHVSDEQLKQYVLPEEHDFTSIAPLKKLYSYLILSFTNECFAKVYDKSTIEQQKVEDLMDNLQKASIDSDLYMQYIAVNSAANEMAKCIMICIQHIEAHEKLAVENARNINNPGALHRKQRHKNVIAVMRTFALLYDYCVLEPDKYCPDTVTCIVTNFCYITVLLQDYLTFHQNISKTRSNRSPQNKDGYIQMNDIKTATIHPYIYPLYANPQHIAEIARKEKSNKTKKSCTFMNYDCNAECNKPSKTMTYNEKGTQMRRKRKKANDDETKNRRKRKK